MSFESSERDVFESEKAQLTLGLDDWCYRRLFEASGEAMVVVTSEGRLLDANRAALQFLGYEPDEACELGPSDVYVSLEDRERLVGTLEEHGDVKGCEIELSRKDGETIIGQISATMQEDLPGTDTAYFLVVRDITEQKRVQQALKESERQFRKLAEQSIMGIVIVQDGMYQYVNERMATMFGYEREELVDKRGPKDLAYKEDWPRVREYMRRRQSGEKGEMRQQARGVRKNGEVIDLEVFGTSITLGGEPAMLCYLLDVTERRQLERELIDVQEEERRRIGRELHDSVGSQLSGVSLMLRSYRRRVENGGEITAEELEELEQRVKEGDREIRRLSHGLHPGGLDERTLEEALYQQVKHVDGRLEGTCRYDSASTLPDLRTDGATHLYRIGQEALSNAVKHSDASNIEVGLHRREGWLVLTVEDDGAGFDLEETSTDGIGLNSMQYRAELIGGAMNIETSPGAGTTVQCYAPIHRLTT